tara:strand:- start:1222 stop:2496 length:1275 start_codon:yes stop_codon:yes gene_type:complete
MFYSSGSIHHDKISGSTNLSTFELIASKNVGKLSITGKFLFISGSNFDIKSTYINPELSFEHQGREYYSSNNTWYESASLLVQYKSNESFDVFFGKSNRHWGIGNSSLIISKNNPSFPLTGFNWNISKKLSLEYFLGSLSSQIEDTTNTMYAGLGGKKLYLSRSIAGHRLKYKLSDNITFSAAEIVIYGNRKFDENYLLPFIPFWSMQHYIGDLDNVQMCGEIVWNIKNNLNFYTSLFVDEWRPEWTFQSNNRNWFGYQFGITKESLISSNDYLQLEYNWTDHRIYKHKFPINNSYTYNYPLGFWAGPHAEYFSILYTTLIKDWKLNSNFSYFKRGSSTQDMLNRQYKDILINRYSEGTEQRIILSINSYKYLLNKKIQFRIGGDFINWINPGFEPNNPKAIKNDTQKFSLNLGFLVTTDFLFN